MWIFTPFLFSVVLCSWLPSFTGFDKDGGHHAATSHDHLAESPWSLNKTDAVSTYELDDDWACSPELRCPFCEILSPGPILPIPPIPLINEPKADSVLEETTTPGLDFPAPGELDAWAQHVFSSNPYRLPINIPDSFIEYLPSATYLPWERGPFFATISGFEGCTSVILTCECGIYLTHLWEPPFRDNIGNSFQRLILDPLQAQTSDRDSWIGVPMLPRGCFTESTRLKALVFSRTRGSLEGDGKDNPHDLSTVAYYPERLDEIKEVLANLLGISTSKIDTVLYTRKMDAGKDETTAMGKILVTFNPDLLNDIENRKVGYQIWAGAVLQYGVPTVDDSDVELPIMYDGWFCAELKDPSNCPSC